MVEVADTRLLSELRSQSSSGEFPEVWLDRIVSAVEAAPKNIFTKASSGYEIRQFDAAVAEGLPEFAYEHGPDSGRNSDCKLWEDGEFNHSVDLYNEEERIAIEIEKSERKRISDDILKFIKGKKSQKGGEPKINFGVLIVPVNYRGSGNLFEHSLTTLDFMRGVLFVDDIAVIGYRDPRED